MNGCFASEQPEATTANSCLVWRENGNRLARARNHDPLPCLDFFEKSRQLRLGFVNIDLLHTPRLANLD